MHGDGDDPSALQLYKNHFGFTANYMAQLRWVISGDGYNYGGFGMTGFATDGTDIPKINSASFSGQGRGQL